MTLVQMGRHSTTNSYSECYELDGISIFIIELESSFHVVNAEAPNQSIPRMNEYISVCAATTATRSAPHEILEHRYSVKDHGLTFALLRPVAVDLCACHDDA